MRARDRDLAATALSPGAGTPYLTFRQFLAIEIVLAAIDGRPGKPGDPRDHRKPAPARGSTSPAANIRRPRSSSFEPTMSQR